MGFVENQLHLREADGTGSKSRLAMKANKYLLILILFGIIACILCSTEKDTVPAGQTQGGRLRLCLYQ